MHTRGSVALLAAKSVRTLMLLEHLVQVLCAAQHSAACGSAGRLPPIHSVSNLRVNTQKEPTDASKHH